MEDRHRDLCSDCAHGSEFEHLPGFYQCNCVVSPVSAPSHCTFYAGPRTPVDVVIMTAVSVESDAVLAELHPNGRAAWKPICTVQNGLWYVSTYESPNNPRARVRLALPELPRSSGLPAAASLTALAVQLFRPSHVAMLGITAGRQGEVGIGDIIVPRELWDYGAGKWEENRRTRRVVFRPRAVPKIIKDHVRQWCHQLGNRREYLSRMHEDWATRHPNVDFPVPRVHIGPMVSGAAVVNTERIWQQVLKQNDKVIALDMEAYGVVYATELAAVPLYSPQCVVIKSVCDYGVDKTDWAQEYAAYTSVKFFKIYLEEFILNEEYRRNPARMNVLSG
jgi:nucleoside phosphorylase